MRNTILWTVTLFIIATLPIHAMLPTSQGEQQFDSFNPLESVGEREAESGNYYPAPDIQWQSFRYSESQTIALVTGSPVEIAPKGSNQATVVETAINFVSDRAKDFGIEGCDLAVDRIHKVGDLTVILIRPQIGTVPIYSSYVTMTLSSHNSLMMLKTLGFGSKTSGSWSLPAEEAIETARNYVNDNTGTAGVEPTWLPQQSTDGDQFLQACHLVTLMPDNPQLRPLIFVDGESGEILASENRVLHELAEGVVRGLVHPEYPQDEMQPFPFPDERITLDNDNQYSDENGEFVFDVNPNLEEVTVTTELRGRWVDVNYEDGRDALFRSDVDPDEEIEIEWNNINSRDDERMLYYHTNFIHSFWKELDPDFDDMDYPVPATCQVGDEYNNAYWNGHGMYFGGGGGMLGRNFALYPDIIYHEFGHGVTGHIYPRDLMPYRDEPGSLNEAWSDYFPATIFDDPLMGEDANGGNYIRNLDNELRYDGNVNPEVHSFSRIISGAMWHSREVLGAETCDYLFHFARYMLGNQYLDYFVDVLTLDDDNDDITDGTPHYYSLYEQFGRHGIGPGVKPNLVVTSFEMKDDRQDGADGNDDGLWESGETVRIDVDLRRDGTLFPPPAEDVRITLSCDCDEITVIRDQVNIGDMRVGDVMDGHQPLLFEVNQDAQVQFANLFLNVISCDDDYAIRDTIRITIGVPELLLVSDGESDEMSVWYESSLDELELIYANFATARPAGLLEDWLDRFESIIWFTGSNRDQIMSEDSRNLLGNFIDDGGNVLLTGQSIGSVHDADEFLEDFFGALVENDSIAGRMVSGVEDDLVVNGMNLLVIGDHGARNQDNPDAISGVGPAAEIFHWDRLEGNPAAGVRSVHANSGAKTVYLGFGLEAVSGLGNTASRAEALNAILTWFGIESGVDGDITTNPVSFELNDPYPNPFNSTFSVPFRLGQSGRVDISIFDVNGRSVWSGSQQFSAGYSIWSIRADDWGAGLYLVKIGSGQSVRTVRAVLLK